LRTCAGLLDALEAADHGDIAPLVAAFSAAQRKAFVQAFQVNYKESADQAAARFAEWLEDVLVRGLEVWRQGI
jgi:hypothetical protein